MVNVHQSSLAYLLLILTCDWTVTVWGRGLVNCHSLFRMTSSSVWVGNESKHKGNITSGQWVELIFTSFGRWLNGWNGHSVGLSLCQQTQCWGIFLLLKCLGWAGFQPDQWWWNVSSRRPPAWGNWKKKQRHFSLLEISFTLSFLSWKNFTLLLHHTSRCHGNLIGAYMRRHAVSMWERGNEKSPPRGSEGEF